MMPDAKRQVFMDTAGGKTPASVETIVRDMYLVGTKLGLTIVKTSETFTKVRQHPPSRLHWKYRPPLLQTWPLLMCQPQG